MVATASVDAGSTDAGSDVDELSVLMTLSYTSHPPPPRIARITTRTTARSALLGPVFGVGAGSGAAFDSMSDTHVSLRNVGGVLSGM
jgi:hypothetical protein